MNRGAAETGRPKLGANDFRAVARVTVARIVAAGQSLYGCAPLR